MGEYHQDRYRKEMKLYAEMYSAFLRINSKEAYLRSNQLMDSTLKGNWISMRTQARTIYLDREDGTQLRVLVVTKKGHQNNNCTGLLWLHGGGYAIGLPEMEVPYANIFTQDDNCVMVLPDYRRSLDAPYPAALNDVYQTLVWMKNNAAGLGLKEDQLFVGGESAGGGLACALTLYARDKKEVNIAFQMPLYPMLDDRTVQNNEKDDSPVWDTNKNQNAWNLYRGNEEVTSPYFAPARETNYEGLPPAFTIITDNEPFYKETQTYFKNLYRAGVEVMYKEYLGCFHAFDITCPMTETAQHARKLEYNVFQYAQNHFHTAQPLAETTEEEEQAIEEIVQDVETQQELLRQANAEAIKEEIEKMMDPSYHAEEEHAEEEPVVETPVEEETAEEVPLQEDTEPDIPVEEETVQEEETSEIPVEEEPAEVTPVLEETSDISIEEEPAEEPVQEEAAPEIPVEEEQVQEETAPETSIEEESEETEPPFTEEAEETQEENLAEVPVEEIASEETEEPAEEVIVEETPVTEIDLVAKEDLPPVDERPVSSGTTVDFPAHIEEDQEIISEEEIDEISRKLSQIPTVVPVSLEETLAQQDEEIAQAKEEEKAAERAEMERAAAEVANKTAAETFTRDDVILLLHKKDEIRKEEPSSETEEKEPELDDTMSHVQELIDHDTTDSLEKIDELVNQL